MHNLTAIQPTPVTPAVSLNSVLDMQDAADRQQALQQAGALNASPPLPRSTHLKNKNTGLVLPWNSLLAEQRDIMVCCDAEGNTDPSAWASDVNSVDYTSDERDSLWMDARQRVFEQASTTTDKHRMAERPSRPVDETTGLAFGARSLVRYYEDLEGKLKEITDGL